MTRPESAVAPQAAPEHLGWRFRAALLCIVVAGAFLRIWGITFGLPHTFARPDEEKILTAALGIFQGDLNPHQFLYPSLYVYATAAGCWLLYAVQHLMGSVTDSASFVARSAADPSALHLVGRGLTALTGVATILVVFSLGRELFSRRTGLIASALVAVAFLHVRDSHFGVTDVPVTFVVVCALWAAAQCATRGATLSRVAITGLLCGLAASTKYNAVLVVFPALVAVADDALRRRRLFSSATVGACAVLGAATIVGFLAASPYIVIDYRGFLAGFAEQQRIFSGLQNGSIIGPARRIIGERGWQHYITFTLPLALGIPLLAAALAGACWLARVSWRRALLVLSFPATYYAGMGTGTLVYARNVVPILPFLCLTAAFLIDGVAEAVGPRLGFRRAAVACAVVLTVVVGLPTFTRSVAIDSILSRPDTRVLGAQWIEARFPEGGAIYQTGIFYGFTQPRPASRFRPLTFDERRGGFEKDGRPTGDLPDVVVRLDSPLVVYSQVPARLMEVLDAHYALEHVIKGSAAADTPPAIYDQQDGLYLPLANLAAVKRPGPDVSVYVRRGPS